MPLYWLLAIGCSLYNHPWKGAGFSAQRSKNKWQICREELRS